MAYIEPKNRKFIQNNLEENTQVMQISFPAIPVRNSCAVIELYKNISKQEFYITIEWSDQLYTLPLDPTRTFQSILDAIIFQIPEVAVFGAVGCYEFVFESFNALAELSEEEISNSTKQLLRTPITEIPLSQGILLYIVNTRRTVDTHRWFVNQFAQVKNENKNENKNKNKITIPPTTPTTEVDVINHFKKILICFAISCGLTSIFVFCVEHKDLCTERDLLKLLGLILVLFSVSVEQTIDLPQTQQPANKISSEQPIVHMCFSRSGIFYKNTHYVFSGTKKDLEFALDKLRQEVYDTQQEPYFNRGNHAELLDTPLDTFCTDKCKCHLQMESVTETSKKNYTCSHWVLQAFDSDEKLDEHLHAIKTKPHALFDNCWYNEIEYI
jgi:hypothetical protein